MKGHKAEKGMVPAVTEKRGRIGERCGKDGAALADWILDPTLPMDNSQRMDDDGSQHGRRMAGGKQMDVDERRSRTCFGVIAV